MSFANRSLRAVLGVTLLLSSAAAFAQTPAPPKFDRGLTGLKQRLGLEAKHVFTQEQLPGGGHVARHEVYEAQGMKLALHKSTERRTLADGSKIDTETHFLPSQLRTATIAEATSSWTNRKQPGVVASVRRFVMMSDSIGWRSEFKIETTTAPDGRVEPRIDLKLADGTLTVDKHGLTPHPSANQ